MTQTNDRFDVEQDNRLADFVDQVLEGKMKQAESNVDDELLSLEQTILRLNQSLPPVSLDEATVKQMQVRLNARIRRESQEVKQPFWVKWFSSQTRPQLGFAFAAIALLIFLFVGTPLLSTDSSSTTGTALTPMNNMVVAGVLVGGILVIFWLMRRK